MEVEAESGDSDTSQGPLWATRKWTRGKRELSLGPPEEPGLSSGEDGEGTHALFSDIGLLELSGMDLCDRKLLGLW